MLLRLRTLASGRTGVRPETAQLLAALLNAGITPIIGEYGSLGCSGDLAPLSHVALALMGEGAVRDRDGQQMPAADALEAADLVPVELAAKEGLALINGTDGMLGMLVMAADDLRELLKLADIAAAMSVEALLGTDRFFRRGPAGVAAASGPGRGRREHARAARRLGDHGKPPRPGLHASAGRLLVAVRSAGGRRGPRHA